MPPEENKAVLRSMFEQVLEAPELDEEAVARHLAPEYQQHVAETTLDYQGFLEHMRAQKEPLAETKISIQHLVAEGEEVCSVHHVTATKNDGGVVRGQVIAHWTFKDGLITKNTELTHMTAGSPEDRDLGSRT